MCVGGDQLGVGGAGLGLLMWRASSYSPAQPLPIQPHLQMELCLVQKPSELPGTECGCLQQWAGLPVLLQPPCVPTPPSGHWLPPLQAFLTWRKLMGSLI